MQRVINRGEYQVVLDQQGSVIKSHRVQSNRRAILDQNAELRKQQGAIKRTDGLRLALDIPISDMPMLEKFWPGISNPGHPNYKWAMRDFLKSPASAPYRVSDEKRGPNAGRIIVK